MEVYYAEAHARLYGRRVRDPEPAPASTRSTHESHWIDHVVGARTPSEAYVYMRDLIAHSTAEFSIGTPYTTRRRPLHQTVTLAAVPGVAFVACRLLSARAMRAALAACDDSPIVRAAGVVDMVVAFDVALELFRHPWRQYLAASVLRNDPNAADHLVGQEAIARANAAVVARDAYAVVLPPRPQAPQARPSQPLVIDDETRERMRAITVIPPRPHIPRRPPSTCVIS